MLDLKLYETGEGGDIFLKGKDMALAYGFINMPYLALFGGNVEQSTPSKRLPGEQAYDWWGNTLLMPNDASVQINSLTERTLMEVALNSGGRILIENAVKEDLKFMAPFGTITVEVTIVGIDKVKIYIKILEPDNLQAKEFIYIWDGTLVDLTMAETVSGSDIYDEYQAYVYNVIETQARNWILWH